MEVQVRVRVPQSYVRLDTVGGAEGRKDLICQLVLFSRLQTPSPCITSLSISTLKKLQQQQCSKQYKCSIFDKKIYTIN